MSDDTVSPYIGQRQGAFSAAFYLHTADTHLDPHPQYALGVDVDADLAAHVAAADPHPGYRLESVTLGQGDMDFGYRLVYEGGTGSPPSPSTGDLWFDTATQALFAWTGSQWMVISPRVKHNVSSANGGSASAGYVGWPSSAPLSVTMPKLSGTSTNLLVTYAGGGYQSAVGRVGFAVHASAADWPIAQQFYNEINEHHVYSGSTLVTGLGASAGYVIEVRMAVLSGGGTLQCNLDDWHTLVVQEVPAL